MKQIAVFGHNGMAGHIVCRYLEEQGHTVIKVGRYGSDRILDVEDTAQTRILVSNLRGRVDYFINCVGLLVADSEARPDRAALVNSWFPQFLAQVTEKTPTKVIHLSTDCVFDGSVGRYAESSPPTETNAYGRSKALGEINNQKDVTFRLSIIGPEIRPKGTGLLNWVLTSDLKVLPGWTNAWWNGITTLQLAKCLAQHIANPVATGIYHLVNNDNRINKAYLIQKIISTYQLDKTVVRCEGPKSIDKTLVDTRQLVDFRIPNYDIMLDELCHFSEQSS